MSVDSPYVATMTPSVDASTLASRYAAVWNEPDPARRRRAITDLWAEDGVEFTGAAEHRGHDALVERVGDAYEQFVAEGGFVFVPTSRAERHHDAVTFSVAMTDAVGVPAWRGRILVLLDEDGRILRDHQFAGEEAATCAAVRELLRRLADDEPERLAELFADAVDWRLNWPERPHPSVPWIRERSTRADVVDHFRSLRNHHASTGPSGDGVRVLVDGSDAVVLGTIRQTVRATGREYVARFALHLSVEDGLITRYHVYEDSLTVAEAFESDVS